MQLRTLALALTILLMAALPASADDVTVDQATLPGGAAPYEVNRGLDGLLYVTDLYGGGQVFRIDAATGGYARFSGLGMAQDARADSAGNIWYTDWATASVFGRISGGASPQLTTWDLASWDTRRTFSLSGLAIDSNNWIWFTEDGEERNQTLFRFRPDTNQLCSYTLPNTGNHSYYVVLHAGSVLWLADWMQGRIVRFNPDPANLNATYWDNDGVVGQPRGLTIDAGGNVWWADEGTDTTPGKVGRLETTGPNANRITTYTPPIAGNLKMISARDGQVWYTAQPFDTQAATVGVLDPTTVSGTSVTVSPGSGTPTADCRPWTGSAPAAITPATGTISGWSSAIWPDITPGGAPGWTIYDTSAYWPYGVLAEADTVWVTDQWNQKLVRISVTPGGITPPHIVISIPAGTTDVQLAWGIVDGAATYRTWYSSTDPYFAPSGAPAADPNPADLLFTHAGATAALQPNYYYVVRAVAPDGVTESGDSNRIGKFSFALVKGSN